MPDYCCVPNCNNRGSGHKFPKNAALRKKWIAAIRRIDPVSKKLWEPSVHHVVCQNHFTADDYKVTLCGERKRLKAYAVPKYKLDQKIDNSMREERRQKRELAGICINRSIISEQECISDGILDQEAQIPSQNLSEPEVYDFSVYVGANTEILFGDSVSDQNINFKENSTQTEIKESKNTSTQCSFSNKKSSYSIFNLQNKSKVVKYYTAFDDYDHFMYFFSILGPAVNELGITQVTLEPEDQLFLTLIKIRQAKDDFELSIMFEIRQDLVSCIYTTWINFLYFQLSELNIWPDKSTLETHMPCNFHKIFPSTRVILDATEIPIQKPHNVNAQRETFSTYKNKNTLKVMIGCTPRGSVSYISNAYGGSASDRQIIERSSLCSDKNLFQNGDSIMADRGIMVQDLFATKNVFVNTPTMLKGKSQLEPHEVHKDRKIASKRIHIERVIGLAKTYKILKKDLNSSLITLGNRIIHVCFYLCNFRSPIVNKSA